MPTLCIKSLSNGIPAAILFIPFYLSSSKFLLDFFLGKCYISKCPCSSVDRVPGYEPVGRRFESRQARQKKAKLRDLAFFSYIRLTARGIAVQ